VPPSHLLHLPAGYEENQKPPRYERLGEVPNHVHASPFCPSIMKRRDRNDHVMGTWDTIRKIS
jgi:hypothetical protein